MNLILFIFVLVISFIVIRIGAVAFHVTGIEWSLSKFQALSCFTGTGFTTREAELIVRTPQRRKIATILMIFGNAGFVVLIASFANSMRAPNYLSEIEIPYLHWTILSIYFPWINLSLIVIFLYVSSKIIKKTKLLEKITMRIKKKMEKKQLISQLSFDEIVMLTGDYTVSKIQIDKSNPLLGKMIGQMNLRNRGVLILMIERQKEIIPVPSFETRVEMGDSLICFGQLDTIKNLLNDIPI